MAGIQVGGIVSGLDTNSIVDKLMKTAQVPVDRLKGQVSYLNVEDGVYSDFNDKLTTMSSDLLALKLESTFKSKTTSSTNDSVATATATTAASAGSHTITVSQLANNSTAGSAYSRFNLSSAGAGVTKVTGLSDDNLEGVNVTTVAQSGTDYLATTDLTVNSVGSVRKSTGADLSSSIVSAYGTLSLDMTGDFSLSYVDKNGDNQTVTVNDTYGSAGDDITQAAATLEYDINAKMNEANGTNAVPYVAVRAEYDSGAKTWNMAMYQTTVDDYQIQVDGTDAGSLRDELGFAEAYTPTTSTTTKITKYHVADSLANLQNKVFNTVGGVVAGGTYEYASGGLTEGTFTIAQDATLNVSSDTYSYYTSGQASGGTGLDTSVAGLDSAGFTDNVSEDANGYFTINGVKINVDDYTQLSVNDLLGIINSSGAGVTASYDTDSDTFKVRSNDPGANTITLGNYSDTSNMLSVMGLTTGDGMTFTEGSTAGNIDPETKLSDAGLTKYPVGGTFTINGVSIYADVSTESLNDVIEKVNNSGAGVTMTYDQNSDKVTLKSDGIEPITVGSADDTSNLLEALNLTPSTTTEMTIGTTGQKSVFQVDGTTYIRDTNKVDDVVSGMTFTLNGTSDSTTTINVDVDTDKGAEAFAKFISDYNSVMEALKVPDKSDDEDNYTSYLSDNDKESMSSDEIATYEQYYELYNRYDVIRRSSELRNMDSNLRDQFFAVRPGISGSINDMSDMGIQVANAGDLDTEFDGYIVEHTTDYDTILSSLKDNQKFMNALANDSGDVYNFFANSVDKDDPSYDTSAGWARYFGTMLDDRYTSDTGMIGSKLGTSGTIYSKMSGLEKRISTQEDRVQDQLERYWSQFTAMEEAISDAQSQASALTGSSSSSSSSG